MISSGSSCGSLGGVPSENQGYWVFSLTFLGMNRPGRGGRTIGAWKRPSPCSGPQEGTSSGSQLGPLGLHEGTAGAKIVVPSLEATRDLLSWEGGTHAPCIPCGQVAGMRRVPGCSGYPQPVSLDQQHSAWTSALTAQNRACGARACGACCHPRL